MPTNAERLKFLASQPCYKSITFADPVNPKLSHLWKLAPGDDMIQKIDEAIAFCAARSGKKVPNCSPTEGVE